MGEWLYYNFAAGSFHTKNFVADFIRLKLNFTQKKNKKSLIWATLWGLRGNVRTPSMARWKASGQLHIRHDRIFFAIFYVWDVMSGNRSQSAFFEGGWVTLSADFRGKGASPTNHCWCQKTRVIALSCSIKISAVHYSVCHKACVWQTDGRTDRRTDRQTDRITIPKTALA